MAERPRYRHTQIGWAMLTIAALVGGGLAWILLRAGGVPFAILVLAFCPLVLLALAFSTLTVAVKEGRLAWCYTLGWPRHSLAWREIESVEAVRTSWFEGWGIHRTRRGWLYNVSGLDAVLVTRRDGRRFLLGSDEPRALVNALRAAIAAREAS